MTLRLKVTSVERYHLCDDSVQNPNVIGCELKVSGKVDRDVATLAVRQVAKRHPMVYARLRDNWWDLDPRDIDKLKWIVVDPDAPGDVDLRTIKPGTGFPAHFVMQSDGEFTRLGFRTHHAAADGVGGLQFISDWMLTYDRIQSQKDEPKSRVTELAALERRNDLRLLDREFIGKLWVQPIAVFGAAKFLFRKVQQLGSLSATRHTENAGDAAADFQVVEHTLSAAAVQALKQLAGERGATVNELILRAVFLGIHDHRQATGQYQKGEWLRLMVPINIRDFRDRRLPAANRSSIVQLDRGDRDFENPEGMVWGLNYELNNIRKWNLEKTFLVLMRLFSCVPGLLPSSVRKDVCRATSVVTNLGAPFERLKLERIDGKLRVGNLLVEDVRLTVPLRNRTPVGFAVLRYRDRQKLCVHFDPLQIERSEVEALVGHVARRLENGDDGYSS